MNGTNGNTGNTGHTGNTAHTADTGGGRAPGTGQSAEHEHREHPGQQGLQGHHPQYPHPQQTGHGGWQPMPQGAFDHEATAFVQLPPEDALHAAPLEAPGHGYVPPMILPLTPVADPQVPPDALAEGHGHHQAPGQPHGGWPEPAAPYTDEPQRPHDPHATGQWIFPDAPEQPGGGPATDITGQWTIPVARGDIPEETGEYTPAMLQGQQWHAPQAPHAPSQEVHGAAAGTAHPETLPGGSGAPWAAGAPATLPGGAPAPWAAEPPQRHPEGVEHAAAGYAPPVEHAPPAEHTGHPGHAAGPGGAGPTGHPDHAGHPSHPDHAELADPADLTGHSAPAAGQAGHSAGHPAPAQAAAPAVERPVEHPAHPQAAEAAGVAGPEAEPASEPGPPAAAPPGAEPEASLPESEPETEAEPESGPEAGPDAGTGPESEALPEPQPGPESGPESGLESGPEVESGSGPESEPEDDAEAVPAPVFEEHPPTSYVLRVNGTDRPVTDAWIGESLLYVLRERLGLAGAKDGCSQGECGACNVQVDGRLVASCLVPAATAAGTEVRTVEGLAADGEPSDVQRALAERRAVQCGFCIPGMAMTVHDLLEGNHHPTELETRQALCGNLCRCSGYRGVLDAVRQVVAEREASAAVAEDAGHPAEGPGPEARIPHQAPPGAGSVQPHPHDGGMA